MKIKDTPIAKRLPKLGPRFISKLSRNYQLGICQGRCDMHKEILNTGLDIGDLAEFDFEKAKKLLPDLIEEHFPKGKCLERGYAIVLALRILTIISESNNIIKWRDK